MHAAFLFIRLAAASIRVGGHLVLAVSLLPEAMSKRDPELVLGFELLGPTGIAGIPCRRALLVVVSCFRARAPGG